MTRPRWAGPRLMKADEAVPFPRPLLEPHGHVGGDEDDMRGAADEPVLGGPGRGDDEGEDGSAVGRGHRDPALAGLEVGVDDESEAELVEVEAEAPVEVAHEDAHRVDAEEGRGDTRREDGSGRRAGRVARHARDYRTGGPGSARLASIPSSRG